MAARKAAAKPRRAPARADDGEPIPFSLPQVPAAEKRRARDLLKALQEHYPDARCALHYSSPHELLIATILSAQCTDAAVNKATPALFRRFPTPADYAGACPEKIQPFIRTLGFHNSKSRALFEAMRDVQEVHGGEVPRTMAELLKLRGVARKTANVVLGNAYGVNVGFVVDTHIKRLARRLCLAPEGATVGAIERRLMALFPRESWTELSHMLIWHGRAACTARGRTGCADHPVCKRFGRCCERRGGS